MTQLQKLTTLARRPSSGRKGWELELWSPKGDELLATYSSAVNPGPIHEGFNTRRYPNNTCGPGSFLALPKRFVGGDPRNIVKLTYDTGNAVVPTYFGYIAKAPDPRIGEISRYDLVSGKELLKNSAIPDTFDTNYGQDVDAAVWLQHFAAFYRHPALKFDLNLIPLTGVLFAGSMYDAAGSNLYEVFQAIIKGCPNIGENDWGVNPEGYIVVQPASGSYTFGGEDFALKYGDRDAEQICTRAKIRLINRVSEGGIASAGYRPHPVSFTYTDPAHTLYEAPRTFVLPEKKDGTPILEVLTKAKTGATYGGWEFLPDGNANALRDDSLATYARPNGSNTSVYAELASTPTNPPVAIDMIIDLTEATYAASVTFAYSFASDSSKELKVTFDLAPYKGKGAVYARLVSPPPLRYGNNTLRYVNARLDIVGQSALQSLVKLYEFSFLVPNAPLLSQIAQSNIRLPARQVSQITFASAVVDDQALNPTLLEVPVKTLRVPGEDGKLIDCEVVEYNDTCSTAEGMLTRAETGQPVRNPIVNTINDAIARALEERG